jgi:hypothetical protein
MKCGTSIQCRVSGPVQNFPADQAHMADRRSSDPGITQDNGKRDVAGIRLADQAELRQPDDVDLERHHPGPRDVLVADDKSRRVIRHQDQQRLLPARVEAGEVGHVREVLAVGVDDDGIETALRHRFVDRGDATLVGRRGDHRLLSREFEVR